MILFAVVIIILCVFPFVIMNRNKRSKEKTFKDSLQNLAASHQSKIDTFDRWNNKIIGIDQQTRKLFFLSRNGTGDLQKVVDLSEMQATTVVKTNHASRYDASGSIKKLDLHFSTRDKSKSDVLLEFYNADHDSLTIREELLLAEKWSGIAASSISNAK